jgi:hypothetical protein
MHIIIGRYKPLYDWNPWQITLCRDYRSYRVAKPEYLQEKKFGPFMLWRVKNPCAALNKTLQDLNLILSKRNNNFI